MIDAPSGAYHVADPPTATLSRQQECLRFLQLITSSARRLSNVQTQDCVLSRNLSTSKRPHRVHFGVRFGAMLLRRLASLRRKACVTPPTKGNLLEFLFVSVLLQYCCTYTNDRTHVFLTSSPPTLRYTCITPVAKTKTRNISSSRSLLDVCCR